MKQVLAVLITVLALVLGASAQQSAPNKPNPSTQANAPQTQDADALEAQYKTCATHYIPSDKCTPEIYQQLKAKNKPAVLEGPAATAFRVIKEYQPRLKNPASMQLRYAYVTDKGDVCVTLGGQNSMGGTSVQRVGYKANNRIPWREEGTLLGGDNPFEGVCKGIWNGKTSPGVEVTETVNKAFESE